MEVLNPKLDINDHVQDEEFLRGIYYDINSKYIINNDKEDLYKPDWKEWERINNIYIEIGTMDPDKRTSENASLIDLCLQIYECTGHAVPRIEYNSKLFHKR